MFDTEILGLKFELIEHLSNHGINWFEHFSDVEACMSESEIKVLLNCAWTEEIEAAFRTWRDDFSYHFQDATGKVKLWRRS